MNNGATWKKKIKLCFFSVKFSAAGPRPRHFCRIRIYVTTVEQNAQNKVETQRKW